VVLIGRRLPVGYRLPASLTHMRGNQARESPSALALIAMEVEGWPRFVHPVRIYVLDRGRAKYIKPRPLNGGPLRIRARQRYRGRDRVTAAAGKRNIAMRKAVRMESCAAQGLLPDGDRAFHAR
jgi:hypothetical protein